MNSDDDEKNKTNKNPSLINVSESTSNNSQSNPKNSQASSPSVTTTSSNEEDLAGNKDRKLKRKKSFKFKQQQQKLSSKSSLQYQSDAEVLMQDRNTPLPPPPEFETKGRDDEVKATASVIISDESELTYLKPLAPSPPIIDINLNIISDEDTGDDDDSDNGANFFLITDTQDNMVEENSAELEEDQEKLAKLFAEQQEKLSQKKKEKRKPMLTPDPNSKIKYESHKWLLKNINFTRDERIFDVTRMLNEYDKNKMSDLFNDEKESVMSESPAENCDDSDEVQIKNESSKINQPAAGNASSGNLDKAPNFAKEEIKNEKFEIDALKQEWSNMFSRLESEYRLKLEEQQLLNDLKLKTLHEEIKKSILEQQELIINKQNQQVQPEVQPIKTEEPSATSSTSIQKKQEESFLVTKNIEEEVAALATSPSQSQSSIEIEKTNKNNLKNATRQKAQIILLERIETPPLQSSAGPLPLSQQPPVSHLHSSSPSFQPPLTPPPTAFTPNSRAQHHHSPLILPQTQNNQEQSQKNQIHQLNMLPSESTSQILSQQGNPTPTPSTQINLSMASTPSSNFDNNNLNLNNNIMQTSTEVHNSQYNSSYFESTIAGINNQNKFFNDNLRMDLKMKHTKHVQDLKDFYEKELSLSKKEGNDRANYLSQENNELKKRLDDYKNLLKNTTDKLNSYEKFNKKLEIQMNERIEFQDQLMHDLQLERRNLIKKTQECDELKDKINIYQQKCENNDFKLEERDNIIKTLNTKLTQMEIEMMRLSNEFDKMRAANAAKNQLCKSPVPPTTLHINDLNKINNHNINSSSSSSSATTHHQYNQYHHHHHKINQHLVEEEETENDSANVTLSPSLKTKTFTIPIKNQYKPYSSPNLAENTNKQPASVSFSDMSQIKYMSSNAPPQQIHLQPPMPIPVTRSSSTSKTTTSVIQTMYQTIKKNANNGANPSTSTPIAKQAPTLEYDTTESSSQSESSSSSRSNSVIRNVATYNLVRARSGSPKVYSCHGSSCSFRSNVDKKMPNRSCSTMGCSYAQQQNFQSQHQQHQQQQQQPQQHRSNLRKLNYSNTINTTMPINNSTSPSPLQHQPIAKQLNSNLSTDQQIKFIQRLESEIDLLSKHKKQLDAQLARLPYKTTNSTVLDIRKSVENERRLVESKLNSARMELRGFNVIKM